MRKHPTLRSSVAWVCLPIIVIFSTSSRITLPDDDGNLYAAWRRALASRGSEQRVELEPRLHVGRLERALDEDVFVGARVELVGGAAAQRSPTRAQPAPEGTRLPSPSRRRAPRLRGSTLNRAGARAGRRKGIPEGAGGTTAIC